QPSGPIGNGTASHKACDCIPVSQNRRHRSSKCVGSSWMRFKPHCFAVALLCSVGSLAHADDKTYKWVDENGVTHYGDSVPAQYAKKETHTLNKQGMEVARTEAQKSAEELAEEARE